jgi:hypothetical protein
MDVRVDETWNEGFARCVDLVDARRRPIGNVDDALDAAVADDHGAVALDRTAAPIPDRHVEEYHGLVHRHGHHGGENVGIPHHEPPRRHPVGDPQGSDGHDHEDEYHERWHEDTPHIAFLMAAPANPLLIGERDLSVRLTAPLPHLARTAGEYSLPDC